MTMVSFGPARRFVGVGAKEMMLGFFEELVNGSNKGLLIQGMLYAETMETK